MACVARACGPTQRSFKAKSKSCAQQTRARIIKSEIETTSDSESDTTGAGEETTHGGQGLLGPTSAQQHPSGWLKLTGQHDTEQGACNGSFGSLTSRTVSSSARSQLGSDSLLLQPRTSPSPGEGPVTSSEASNGLGNPATVAPCYPPVPAAAEQRPSPVWSDLLGARLHNYVSELREKAAARDSDGTDFTTAILQHQLLRLQRRSPHGGSVSAREMDALNRRLRIHGAAAAAAAAAAVSRAARSGGAGAATGLGLIKAAPRGGLPPGYRLVRDALLEAARAELLEGLKRVSAAQIAEGLMATAPPPPTILAGRGGGGSGGGPGGGVGPGGGAGAGLALNTIYTGTMDVKGNARACLPGRAAVMVGVLGLLALEPAWVLPALPPPKLPSWRSSPASASASVSASTSSSAALGLPLGALGTGRSAGAISGTGGGSSSSSNSSSTTSIALLGGGGRGQHLSAAVALADALLRHRGLPPLPYHELRMLVVLIALLQEHPDLVDPVSGAPGCPTWALASALELLVPLAGVLATSPVCGMAGSADAVAHARTAGPVVAMHLAAAQAGLAAAQLTQGMATKQGRGVAAAASQGGVGGGGVTARGGSGRSSTSSCSSSSAATTTTITSTSTSNGTSCCEDGSEAGDAAPPAPAPAPASSWSTAAAVDPRLFVREYVRSMKRQAERLSEDGLEQAPLCLWVASRLPQALAPYLELGGPGAGPAGAGPAGAGAGAGAAPVPLPPGARSGAGGGGGGVLRLSGAVRRDRLLRYELLRTVLATGLDGAPRSVQAAGGDALKALLMSAAVVGYLRGASAWEAEQILVHHHHSSSSNTSNTSSNGGSNGSSSVSGSSNGSSSSSSSNSSLSPGGKAAGSTGVVRGVDEGPVGLRLSSCAAVLPADYSSATAAAAARGGSCHPGPSSSAAAPAAAGLVAASLVPCSSAHLMHCRALREGQQHNIEVMAASGVVEAPRDPHAQRRLRERVLAALRERRAVRLQCLSGPTVELAMLVLAQVCSDLRLDGQDVVVVPELDPPDDQLPAAVAELMGGLVEPLGAAGGGGGSGPGAVPGTTSSSWRQQALAVGAVSAEAGGADAEPDAWGGQPPLAQPAPQALLDAAADGTAVILPGSTGAPSPARSASGGGGGGGGLRDGWRVLRRAGINRAACALLGVAGVGGSNEAEEAEALDGRLLADFYPGLLAAMRRAAAAAAAGAAGGTAGLGFGAGLTGLDVEAGLTTGLATGLEAGDGLEEELMNAAGREYERVTARPRLCDIPERVWVTLCVMVCAPGRLGAPGRPLPLQEPPPPGPPAATAGGKRQQQAGPASASVGTGAAAATASGAGVAALGADAGAQAVGGAAISTAAARPHCRRAGAAATVPGTVATAATAPPGSASLRAVGA